MLIRSAADAPATSTPSRQETGPLGTPGPAPLPRIPSRVKEM